jgi:hypothetical protein
MFKHDIQTTIDIEASRTKIWEVLLDLSRYDDWNPMLRNVHTGLQTGDAVSFEVLREGNKPLKLKAKIITRDEETELSWRGGSAALISGHHYFRIEPLGKERCRFHHGEYFKGILVPLLKSTLRDAPDLYRAMNEALKSRVERQA